MIRVGVIGLGVGMSHIKSYEQIDDVKVVAVADANEERLSTFKYADVKKCSSYEEICEDSEIEVVSVCLPNSLHEAAAVMAFDNGKHVMCEKPLAHCPEAGIKIVEAAKRSGKKFMMNLHLRFQDAAQQIKRKIDAGEFGDVYYSFSTYLRQPGGIPRGVGGWFYQKDKSGGGALLDNGVHLIDQQWYLMGCPRPVEVTGQTFTKFGPAMLGNEFDVDDFCTGIVRFDNGGVLVFENAWASIVDKPTHNVRILGSKMGATVNPFTLTALKGEECKNISPDAIKTENPMSHFIRCIQDDTEPMVTPEQGLVMLRVLDGLYQSARCGKSITIE